jgi:hypothetical protein
MQSGRRKVPAEPLAASGTLGLLTAPPLFANKLGGTVKIAYSASDLFSFGLPRF